MSFLRSITTKAPRLPPSLAARFSTTPLAKKDATSGVKDTIESVNKSVGESAARGIEKGQATASLKSSVGLNKSKAEGEMNGGGEGWTREKFSGLREWS
ncbi:hypothetical protein BDR22DRAFT_387033 [Usnea florida]